MPTVWGNESSGKLFCPGARYYGVTKTGRYFVSPPIGELVRPTSKSLKIWKPSTRGGSCMK